MKPIKKTVIAEIDQPKDQITSGLLLMAPKDVNIGTVTKVGDQINYLKPGDRIMWHKNAGIKVDDDGKECILLSEDKQEIIAIL